MKTQNQDAEDFKNTTKKKKPRENCSKSSDQATTSNLVEKH